MLRLLNAVLNDELSLREMAYNVEVNVIRETYTARGWILFVLGVIGNFMQRWKAY
jgi:hypothetical protein